METDYQRLEYELDQAERKVHELTEELNSYEEETEEWYDVLQEVNDAENELYYIQTCLENFTD